jgi:putative photosynthetic complex assembly protein
MTPEQKLVERDREMIPVLLLRALLVLVICALMIVAYARITDRPLEAMPTLEGADVGIAKERAIFISGELSGAARVLDGNGTVIADLDETEGGFVAGMYRVLKRTRTQAGLSPDLPVRLVRFENGQLSLRDDYTGWRAELTGFGAQNHATFAKLLEE